MTSVSSEALRKFLLDSNGAGYAGGEEKKWTKESDGSTTIPYEKGEWRSHDNFFGGEPYGGRVVVFHRDRPVWMMVYYGWVVEGIETNPVYAVLRRALMRMPEEYPFRGPKEYREDEYVYVNKWTGDIKQFSGEEKISQSGKVVYKANYLGGLVDRRAGI